MSQPSPWPDSTNLAYVEQLYEQYVRDPQSVDAQWRRQFELWTRGDITARSQRIRPSFTPGSLFNPAGGNGAWASNGNGQAPSGDPSPISPIRIGPADPSEITDKTGSLQHRVFHLIRNYRVRGHIAAHIDPLERPVEEPRELQPAYFGFTEKHLDRAFNSGYLGNHTELTLRDIIRRLREVYCGNVGIQYMHIDDLQVRDWLQLRIESGAYEQPLTRKEQVRILTRLTDASIFEEFIQRKFIGAKSFSLEGAESLIPLLDMALETAGDQGVREVVIGMAHRGRLNVLANILGKSPQKIFREFEDLDPRLYMGGGDVKYHLGYSGDWRTRHGQNIHLSLCFNPSHLEFVNPVALGRLRAKQDRYGDSGLGEKGMGVLIHGDAAFIGEGVVQETLNLSQLKGYATGGTLHVIVNNQIGFTTGAHQARSTRYASDVAKMLQIPIFHVNGEAPEAVAQVIRLAMDFRAQFKRDVVLDMYCYRKRGHNEGDEPSYTQPKMYGKISERKTVREGYLGRLKKLGGISDEDAERISKRRTELLEKELTAARSESYIPKYADTLGGVWSDYRGGLENEIDDVPTGIETDQSAELLVKQTELPEGFRLHPKLERFLSMRREMADGERKLDWAAAESLAFGSLAVEGHRVRLSGQDSQRGTFSQRHTVFHDNVEGTDYMPLANLTPDQAPVEIYNSPLSEIGVLGFDYGYSLDCPEGLVMWEAQFGDFVNVAQVVFDQFIASAEDKWKRFSGLVMLLPHGFEGQGPEHSSARLERWLMSAAEDNIQVTQPTTPAQYFHLLRRQVLRRWRKPLVVLTPKSLLRAPQCVSSLKDVSEGTFRRVIGDESGHKPADVSRVLLCTGKVYYDLVARREELGRTDVDIVRLEQLYPFPTESLRALMTRYRDDTHVIWVQDEPANMGAWPFMRGRFCAKLYDRLALRAVTRPESASPATGSRAAHQIEQEELLSAAFGA